MHGICGIKIPSATYSRFSDTFELTVSALRMVHSTTIWVNGEDLLLPCILDFRQKSSDDRLLKNHDTLHPIFIIANQ